MLVAKNLTKTYGSAPPALDGAGLTLVPGEFVAVTGRSGSGKSTLLGVLAGLLTPDSGSLNYNGLDLTSLSEADMDRLRRRDFAVIFQAYHLLPYLTALENTLLPSLRGLAPVSRLDRERALDCLARVGLADKADRLPGQLSGGEQQRVAVARALAKGSRVLFADEPTGNLDERNGEAVMDLLAGLADQGMAVLMVTHDQAHAARAHRALEMADGRMLGAEALAFSAPCPSME